MYMYTGASNLFVACNLGIGLCVSNMESIFKPTGTYPHESYQASREKQSHDYQQQVYQQTDVVHWLAVDHDR